MLISLPLFIKPAKDTLRDIFFPPKFNENNELIQYEDSTFTHAILVISKRNPFIDHKAI